MEQTNNMQAVSQLKGKLLAGYANLLAFGFVFSISSALSTAYADGPRLFTQAQHQRVIVTGQPQPMYQAQQIQKYHATGQLQSHSYPSTVSKVSKVSKTYHARPVQKVIITPRPVLPLHQQVIVKPTRRGQIQIVHQPHVVIQTQHSRADHPHRYTRKHIYYPSGSTLYLKRQASRHVSASLQASWLPRGKHFHRQHLGRSSYHGLYPQSHHSSRYVSRLHRQARLCPGY